MNVTMNAKCFIPHLAMESGFNECHYAIDMYHNFPYLIIGESKFAAKDVLWQCGKKEYIDHFIERFRENSLWYVERRAKWIRIF